MLTVDDILNEVQSAKMIFIDGGGVTFTGGEVTCQKEPILRIIRELKKQGISTCIETNASLPDCYELFDEVDYMIADFKSPDADKLKEVTGGEIEIIKENLLHRAKIGKHLLIRIPLVHFFNCGYNNAVDFADFFEYLKKESNNKNLCFEILTYHEFGKDKYKNIKKEYTVTDGFVNDEDVKILTDELLKRNLKIIRT